MTKRITLHKEFVFDSAHSLPCVPDGHPCGNLHGHTWKLIVGITGVMNEERGWILDFKDVKNVVNAEVVDVLDHAHLNDHVKNPTSETLVQWIWDRLEAPIQKATDGKVNLFEITVYETATSYCTLRQ